MSRFQIHPDTNFVESKDNRIRVLIVGMANSIHLARWINQFKDDPIDFVVVASIRISQAHELIHTASESWESPGATLEIIQTKFWKSRFVYILDKLAGQRLRGKALSLLISKRDFDFVHLVEFQHAGYLYLASRADLSKTKARLISTNYGSDIFWFRRFPRHAKKITQLLKLSDRYSAECMRDVHLAKSLGFNGMVLPVVPNAGGFAEEFHSLELSAVSERKKILIKGYDSWVGKASLGLAAIEILAKELSDFTIVIYSCGRKLRRRAIKLSKKTGLPIETYRPGSLDHRQMLQLFSEARIYVGISLSDGISTSMLEALVMGCFPVQSSSACVDEWFESGKGGIAIASLRPPDIASQIREALVLTASTLAEDAWSARERVLSKLSTRDIYAKAIQFYLKDAV